MDSGRPTIHPLSNRSEATINFIGKLSDHAAVLMRQREAKGCMIIVIERDGTTSIGTCHDGANANDVQEALCAAISHNREQSHFLK